MKEAIKKLRDLTGFGIADCKKALEQSKGDLDKALSFLKEKGAQILEEKRQRQTKEGLVEAYIHFSQNVGAMVEINCETDFVSRDDTFRKFAKDIAMQIAALSAKYVSKEDVPGDVIKKLKAGEKEAFLRDNCLLQQQYIKDNSMTISDYLNTLGAKFKENITIRRFVRFSLGEE